ncbi:hypothetical protein Micbo1qcDRAFT_210326 [Microdochium bolleyi]|uniref:P-loop containing nucleoside triphosphate hydrolase protein n=1 Tax=Microdochium bolleyi TaxID=196109 RepID=A0A136IJY6_9PEZI|nr:hypothetical protein Micbo1qcDRAFT_210326 [Microdochium bolleyi]
MPQTVLQRLEGRVVLLGGSKAGKTRLREQILKAVAEPNLDFNIDERTRIEKKHAERLLHYIAIREYTETWSVTSECLPHKIEVVEVPSWADDISEVLAEHDSPGTVVLLLYDPRWPFARRQVLGRWEKLKKVSFSEASSMKPILVSTFSDQPLQGTGDSGGKVKLAGHLGFPSFAISLRSRRHVHELIAEIYRSLGVACPDIEIEIYSDAGEDESLHAEPDDGLQAEMWSAEHDKEPQAGELQAEDLPAQPPKEGAQREDFSLEDSPSEKVWTSNASAASGPVATS